MINKKDLIKRPDIRLGALKDFAEDNTAKNYRLRVTSGTTGDEIMLFVNHRGCETLREEKRILSGMSAVVLCFGGVITRSSLIEHFLFFYGDNDRRIICITEADLAGDVDKIIAEFSPDGFYGFPSFIAQTLLKIKNPEVLNTVKYIRLAGECVGHGQLLVFRNKVPHAKVENFYAAAEIGYISSFPCGFLGVGEFHPAKNIDFKIIDRDKEGAGEIVLSADISPSVRLDGYATGDLGRLLDKKCPCGDPVSFEILGRKNFDFIKLLGAVLRQEIFEEEIMKFNFVNDFRVLAREIPATDKMLGHITVLVELKESQKEKKDAHKKTLEEKLPEKLFLTPTRTLKQLVDAGLFLPLDVEIEDEFPSLMKKVKMKKID